MERVAKLLVWVIVAVCVAFLAFIILLNSADLSGLGGAAGPIAPPPDVDTARCLEVPIVVRAEIETAARVGAGEPVGQPPAYMVRLDKAEFTKWRAVKTSDGTQPNGFLVGAVVDLGHSWAPASDPSDWSPLNEARVFAMYFTRELDEPGPIYRYGDDAHGYKTQTVDLPSLDEITEPGRQLQDRDGIASLAACVGPVPTLWGEDWSGISTNIDAALSLHAGCDELLENFVAQISNVMRSVDEAPPADHSDSDTAVEVDRYVELTAVNEYHQFADSIGCATEQERQRTAQQLGGLVPATAAGQIYLAKIIDLVVSGPSAAAHETNTTTTTAAPTSTPRRVELPSTLTLGTDRIGDVELGTSADVATQQLEAVLGAAGGVGEEPGPMNIRWVSWPDLGFSAAMSNSETVFRSDGTWHLAGWVISGENDLVRFTTSAGIGIGSTIGELRSAHDSSLHVPEFPDECTGYWIAYIEEAEERHIGVVLDGPPTEPQTEVIWMRTGASQGC